MVFTRIWDPTCTQKGTSWVLSHVWGQQSGSVGSRFGSVIRTRIPCSDASNHNGFMRFPFRLIRNLAVPGWGWDLIWLDALRANLVVWQGPGDTAQP